MFTSHFMGLETAYLGFVSLKWSTRYRTGKGKVTQPGKEKSLSLDPRAARRR